MTGPSAVHRPGGGGAVGDDERVAWATLLRVAEPGVASLARHVRAVGVEQTLLDIRASTPIEGVEVAALRHRLATASGAADLATAARVGARLVCAADEEWPALLDDLRWV
ncbi:MAG: processing protein, partial [Frankiaceae bacterium]|nr:processing protein [Frankiaceae bacterium]